MLMRREPTLLLKSGVEQEIEPWCGDAESYSAGTESWDVRSLMAALSRRRWWAIGTVVVAVVGAIVYLLLATPIYEARVKLLIESESPNVVSFKEVIEQNTEKLDYYETQLGILRSRTLARKTIERLELWNHPDLARNSQGLADKMLSMFKKDSKPSRTHPDETAAQSRSIDAFLESLTISYRADNRLVDVGFRSTDPRVSADVANMLARAYIDQNLELKHLASKEASDWLNARLAEQRTQVEASELSLQRYRERNADVSLSEQQNIIVQRLAELSTAATHAKTERIDAESLFQQLQAIQNAPSRSDTLPMALANPLILQLKTDLASLRREEATLTELLGDRHPDLVKVRAAIPHVEGQLRAEVAKVADSVRNQILAMREKERSMAAALEAQERLALALNRRGIQYGALQREVTSNRQIFDALLERAKQTQISSELKIANVQIIDPAEVPQLPASPQPKLALLLALLLGLPFAVGTALSVDYLDDRLQSPDEIKTHLGLRFLGFAPAMAHAKSNRRMSLVKDGITPEFAEALRTVRANLCIGAPPATTNILLVTSTGPGEGKTIVASNMAVALAQAGRRVLLVDADLRRCQIHEIFKTPLERGLSTVLKSGLPMSEAVVASDVDGLSIMTAGATPANPGDLLEGFGFSEALESVADRFDWIVVDSPPVMVASDATSLARVATAVLFVVGSQMTSPRHARAALEQLDSVRAKIVGAVLSRGRAYRYSPYADYTARSYSRYGLQS